MLIDWVTARIPLECLSPDSRLAALNLGDRISRFCPASGIVRYETTAWESIRSDSHQISIKVGASGFCFMGSPARVLGDGCAVFGSGASSSLDLAGCVDAMRLFVQASTGIELPGDLRLWFVTRVDVTGNLLLASCPEVRDALRVLRDCEGGRYRVSAQAGDSVYWSHKSKLRAGKAYAKGPHLRYLMKQKTYSGRPYSDADFAAADRVLRLELKLGREFWSRHDWRSFSVDDLSEQWNCYFSRMIGSAEMKTDENLKEQIMLLAPTDGAGRAAYGCWLLIQSEGWERARESFAKTSWYRHLKIFRAAGLGDADISAGKIVPLRRRVFEARIVRSWHELKNAA